jgi:aminoglycoside phosphotransferase family enzyme
MNDLTTRDDTDSLKEKVKFLSQPLSYQGATKVEVLETHMSWVFLTDRYVYKLKKPVTYPFLDFSTLPARHKFCMEEVRVNQPLGGDTYLGVVPLKSFRGLMQLEGMGEPIDWLVKMRRLPMEWMLHTAIMDRTVRNEWVLQAAEKLVDFYVASVPVRLDAEHFRRKNVMDIELDSGELLDSRFKLKDPLVVAVTTDLLHFLIKHAELFDQRIADGKVIDAHGDLRPEHICLGPHPVIIDRIEFNKDLRVMDIAEELSALALECDILGSPGTGQLFYNVYRWRSQDKIPDMLIQFYKAKRAFLRARLSIWHLLEEKYLAEETKWRSRCEAYLKAADAYCEHLPKKC